MLCPGFYHSVRRAHEDSRHINLGQESIQLSTSAGSSRCVVQNSRNLAGTVDAKAVDFDFIDPAVAQQVPHVHTFGSRYTS